MNARLPNAEARAWMLPNYAMHHFILSLRGMMPQHQDPHKPLRRMGCAVVCLVLSLFFFARTQNTYAQLAFSDSLRLSLLTCSPGPDAYERFGHAGIRVEDLRQPDMDVTFHYGVFSFNAPHFIYRFVKGETDYKLGALYTSDFIAEYRMRGLGMTQQVLHLDSAQQQQMVERLLVNYRPENRTYRYSYLFDNCSTRPYRLLMSSTEGTIVHDSTWTHALTLREMIQEKSGRNNWLDFGIAITVAQRADQAATYDEQMFLPDYLMGAVAHATVPMQLGDGRWMVSLCDSTTQLLTMRSDIAEAIAAPEAFGPIHAMGLVALLALVLWMLEVRQRRAATGGTRWLRLTANGFDSVLFLLVGLAGALVYFLNFASEHPAVSGNINCLWLLPTHLALAVVVWVERWHTACRYYCMASAVLLLAYMLLDWVYGQYCPPAFLLLQGALLVRYYIRITRSNR